MVFHDTQCLVLEMRTLSFRPDGRLTCGLGENMCANDAKTYALDHSTASCQWASAGGAQL